MKTTQEKIEIMQAYLDGKDIEITHPFLDENVIKSYPNHDSTASSDVMPIWNWEVFSYRIKPKLKNWEIVKAFSEGKVVYWRDKTTDIAWDWKVKRSLNYWDWDNNDYKIGEGQ